MPEKKAIRVAYGEALAELGSENPNILVLDADLAHATMTCIFAEKFPGRFINAGVAEQNMTGMAVGLASAGFIPFISAFAVFGSGRAYDQIRNSIAYPKFNVKIAFTHGGITVGEDGGSHQAIEDIALMRVIPNMTIVVPCDAIETRKAIRAAAGFDGPIYIRLARTPSEVFTKPEDPFELGKANVLCEGSDAVVFATGIMVYPAVEAARRLKAQDIHIAVVNIHTIKPMDRETVLRYALKCKRVIAVEEHSVIGGLGDALADVLIGNALSFRKIGVQDCFGQSGKPEQLLMEYGLTDGHIAQAVKDMMADR